MAARPDLNQVMEPIAGVACLSSPFPCRPTKPITSEAFGSDPVQHRVAGPSSPGKELGSGPRLSFQVPAGRSALGPALIIGLAFASITLASTAKPSPLTTLRSVGERHRLDDYRDLSLSRGSGRRRAAVDVGCVQAPHTFVINRQNPPISQMRINFLASSPLENSCNGDHHETWAHPHALRAPDQVKDNRVSL